MHRDVNAGQQATIMTKYSLRARMMILILAPTLMVGLLLSSFFVVHRYNELQRQVIEAGANILEPLAISTEYSMTWHNRDALRGLVSLLHRRHSGIVRAISVFDDNNQLYVTSNNNQNLSLESKQAIRALPDDVSIEGSGNLLILRKPITSERYAVDELPEQDAKPAGNPLGYVAMKPGSAIRALTAIPGSLYCHPDAVVLPVHCHAVCLPPDAGCHRPYP